VQRATLRNPSPVSDAGSKPVPSVRRVMAENKNATPGALAQLKRGKKSFWVWVVLRGGRGPVQLRLYGVDHLTGCF
jgi:hypothetical protein